MNYVGLGQQGFYQPFEMLGQALDRMRQRNLQKQQLGFEREKWGDELTRQKGLDALTTARTNQEIDSSKIASAVSQNQLRQNQETEQTEKNLNATDINLAPEFAGKRFFELPPEVQNFVHQGYSDGSPIPPSRAQSAQRYDAQVAATSAPRFPVTPPGTTPTEYSMDPAKGWSVKALPTASLAPSIQTVTDPSSGTEVPFGMLYRGEHLPLPPSMVKPPLPAAYLDEVTDLQNLRQSVSGMKEKYAKAAESALGTGKIAGNIPFRTWFDKNAKLLEEARQQVAMQYPKILNGANARYSPDAMERIQAALPSARTPKDVANVLFQDMDDRINAFESNKRTNYGAAGYPVDRLPQVQLPSAQLPSAQLPAAAGVSSPTAAQGIPKFSSLAEFDASPLPAGTIAEVFDSKTSTYRRAQK